METCENCRFWSETVAQSIGCGPMEAMCENSASPYKFKMLTGDKSCSEHKPPHDPRLAGIPDVYGSV